MLNKFDEFEVQLHAINLLSSKYLKTFEIMDAHYGIINRVSKHGYEIISEEAKVNFHMTYLDYLKKNPLIFGAHQFLKTYPEVSAKQLSDWTQEAGIEKFANGTYCSAIQYKGDPFLILSPFHPFQLEYFTSGEKTLIVFEGLTHTPWTKLRNELVGATNPANAINGSIRNFLFTNQGELNISTIDQRYNGIHLSAGPLEGMVEIQRFFSDYKSGQIITFNQTTFGLNCRNLDFHLTKSMRFQEIPE